MGSLLDWIRAVLTREDLAHHAEHDAIERRLADQERRLRLARIDAGLPVDRRQRFAADHPGRRVSDGHA